MRKTSIILLLCLCLCSAGAMAEEPALVTTECSAVYDGTVLRATVIHRPVDEDTIVVDWHDLSVDYLSDRARAAMEEQLATGQKILGIALDPYISAGDTALDNWFPLVAMKMAEGGLVHTVSYVLPPDFPREGLQVTLRTSVRDDIGGEQIGAQEDVVAIDATNTVAAAVLELPVDLTLDGAAVDAVRVSHSPEAFCVMVRTDGTSQPYFTGTIDGTAISPVFSTNEDDGAGNAWKCYVYDPLDAMPTEIVMGIGGGQGLVINTVENTCIAL